MRGRPDELVVGHVGREVLEVRGDASVQREVQDVARVLGLVTRPAGTSVAVLGVERARVEDLPVGRRRAATLEDAFVVLTGEELS